MGEGGREIPRILVEIVDIGVNTDGKRSARPP
jgi:hypothetical protein